MAEQKLRIGIDLGGTKTEILVLDTSGTEILRRRVPTPKDDYQRTLDQIVELVHYAERDIGQRATVGIGMPGSISRATGLVRGANSVCLNGRAIKPDLERLLERELRIANDANCFALSEATDGAASSARVVFGAIIGTGVGGGVVVDGKVLDGPNAIAGEWGHNPLPWPQDAERPGPPCFCGRYGCIETFVSGPGLARDHAEAFGIALSTADIALGASSGDISCRKSLVRYTERLARSFAHVINMLDPDIIVLGGGMSNIESLYSDVPRQWGPFVFADRVDTRLVRHHHGDSSGVRGAAWLWRV